MSVHFLRYAECNFTADPDCEERNCNLTIKGRSQAEALTSKIHYDVVLCSPLLRCTETLRLSNISYSDVIIVEDLREFKQYICDFFEHEIIQKEHLSSLFNRINNVRELLKSYINKNVLIVGHADFFFYLTAKLIKGEYEGSWLVNAELYTDGF